MTCVVQTRAHKHAHVPHAPTCPRASPPRRMARHRARSVVQGSTCWALSIRTPALARRWPFRPRRTAGASHPRRLRPTKPFRVSSLVIVPCARRREAATATFFSLAPLATAVSISTRVPPAEPVLRNSPSALLLRAHPRRPSSATPTRQRQHCLQRHRRRDHRRHHRRPHRPSSATLTRRRRHCRQWHCRLRVCLPCCTHTHTRQQEWPPGPREPCAGCASPCYAPHAGMCVVCAHGYSVVLWTLV